MPWNLIKKSQRHLIMYEAWQAWRTVQTIKCADRLHLPSRFPFFTNRKRSLKKNGTGPNLKVEKKKSPVQNFTHQKCLVLIWSKQLSVDINRKTKRAPVYNVAKHRAANFWQRATRSKQAAHQWKDCGFADESELRDLCCKTMATAGVHTLPGNRDAHCVVYTCGQTED